MDGVGTKSGLVPEQDLRLARLCLGGDGRKGLGLPLFNGFGIALIGPLQRLLRSQSQARKQPANRGQRQSNAKSGEQQLLNDLPCPKTEVKPIPDQQAASAARMAGSGHGRV